MRKPTIMSLSRSFLRNRDVGQPESGGEILAILENRQYPRSWAKPHREYNPGKSTLLEA